MHATTGLDAANAAESRRRFQQSFPDRPRVFLPVIYTADESQALRNVEVAREAEGDGVFLVNHGIGYQQLLRIAGEVVRLHPDLFVGVNCLDLRPQDVVCRLPQGVSAVWTNSLPADETAQDMALALRQARQESGWPGMFFASVPAHAESDYHSLLDAVAAAAPYVDVPTVVGNGSGPHQDARFCQKLRKKLGEHPIGIAAHITSEFVDTLLPHADCVLTTASSSSALEQMDLAEATRLAAKTHACH